MKKVIHINPWFSLEKHILSNKNGVYYFLNKKPTVFIFAETKEHKIFLVQEYRYPIKKLVWQLPGGMIDKGGLVATAKKELLEETGICAKQWLRLGQFFVAPGHENTRVIVYLARILSNGQSLGIHEDNIKNVKAFSKEEILLMIKRKKIVCGITLAALTIYLHCLSPRILH